jgi:REP element-mobilizing transposase RayT
MRDFDDNDFPRAYLITFRCYGTWLHGDDRASTDRKHNIYGAKKIAPNQRLQLSDESHLKNAPLALNARQRSVVEGTIREVCTYRRYGLRAINVRTNHVHLVVSAASRPEPILNTFKSYSTRALRAAGLLPPSTQVWARHGSTVYLWKEDDVSRAVAYVVFSQGDESFRLED